MNRSTCLCAVLSSLFVVACSYHARSADDYRKVTRELLETRRPTIKTCYDTELQQDKQVGGQVVVQFKVEAETGVLKDFQVVPERTTAPESLSSCVVSSLDGLVLEPPDERTGDAEYTWEFQVEEPNQG